MVDEATHRKLGHFDVLAMARRLPTGQDTMIADTVLTSREAASARLIRTLAPVPAHHHTGCDEFIYILEGLGTVWLQDSRNEIPFAHGDLLFVAREVVHAMPRLFDGSVLSFSVDTPRRDSHDIVTFEAADRPFASR